MSPSHTSRVRSLSLWAPVIGYMVAIFFVSNLQVAPLPEDVSDKTAHLWAYAGLAILAVRAVAGGLPRPVIFRVAVLAFLIAAGYGIFDEVHQLFVPGRSGELFDWFADASGSVVGIAVCWLWGIIASRHRV